MTWELENPDDVLQRTAQAVISLVQLSSSVGVDARPDLLSGVIDADVGVTLIRARSVVTLAGLVTNRCADPAG